MALKKQVKQLKENWLLVVILIAVLLVFSGFNSLLAPVTQTVFEKSGGYGYGAEFYDSRAPSGLYPYYGDEGFAPDVEDRKITKTSSLTSEVERGEFLSSEGSIESISSSTNSFILNKNSQKNGKGFSSYYSGYYTIKTPTTSYDLVVSQLKEIGEVTSFNENAADITARYTELEIELAAERDRLRLYKSLLAESDTVTEKIELTDRIFNQERTISYLEDALEKTDSRVEYSTITVSLVEERSSFENISLIKLGDIVKSFIGSINALIWFVFILIPWIVLFLILKALKKRFD